ncbi:DNA polymerase [Pseudoalteromonas sp. T1lg76]|uniref:DNA polymerase n=1 Tax=Pseudoalteromonas sp. T1lg76 TaxID=2077103 RepID=UPI000CF6221D|nr:DNA polymerase [Pseudoalteromonas sp. T1lg76]
MSKGKTYFLLYQKDFSEKGGDRYFLYDGFDFAEVSSEKVISLEGFIVTHDYWLLASSIYKDHQSLPNKVIDAVLLSKIVAGHKSAQGDVQAWDISQTIKPLFNDASDFDKYLEIFYRRRELELDVYMLFAHKLAEFFDLVSEQASKAGESTRFYQLELPIYNKLTLAACKGLRINNDRLREHKCALKHDFYRSLKLFAEKHNVMYAIPNDGEIKEQLERLGFNTQDYSTEYLLDFLPIDSGYGQDLRSLQKLNKSYRIFNSISSGSNRLKPIVETYWTSTSRIYHRSPNLQNISKKYRDIFIADEGLQLCYIDYDQFEVGIMAALSSDPKMKEIYENKDAYVDCAKAIFGDESKRKKAKVLFLSYTYGMSLKNILNSVEVNGGDKKVAQRYFAEFSVYEKWKESIYREYFENGRVSSISGNFLNRGAEGELTEKEKRSAANHVIQATATFIFKKALLKLSNLKGAQILIPMHDAVLFQHDNTVNPESVIDIFERTMTEALEDKVNGKASKEEFYLE